VNNNANLYVLQSHVRHHDHEDLERHWRKARRIATIEGRKKDYLRAWTYLLKMLHQPVPPIPVEIGVKIKMGQRTLEVTSCDHEFVHLEELNSDFKLDMTIAHLFDLLVAVHVVRVVE
jgi:hypothetical protein